MQIAAAAVDNGLRIKYCVFKLTLQVSTIQAPSPSRVLWFSPKEKMPAMPYGWQTKPISEAGSMAAKRTEGEALSGKVGNALKFLRYPAVAVIPTPSGTSCHLPRRGRLQVALLSKI